jgi:hypothetical protein
MWSLTILLQQRSARHSVRGVACWTTHDRPRSGPVRSGRSVARMRVSVRPWKNMSSVGGGSDGRRDGLQQPNGPGRTGTSKRPEARSRRIGFLELTRHQQPREKKLAASDEARILVASPLTVPSPPPPASARPTNRLLCFCRSRNDRVLARTRCGGRNSRVLRTQIPPSRRLIWRCFTGETGGRGRAGGGFVGRGPSLS